MKTLKLVPAVICFIFFNIQSYSQKLTRPQYLSLNNYIEYLNFGAEQLSKEMKCLYDYYGKVESYRKNKKNYYSINTKALCAGKKDSYYYNKAKTESKSLLSADAKVLNTFLDSTHLQYVKIIDQLRELEIYNRLKDYDTDKFKRHDELVKEIQISFKEYKKTHLKLYSETYQIYRRIQPYNRNNIYDARLEKMRICLEEENNKFSAWYTNLSRDSFTEIFPLENIITSINETDVKYFPYRTDAKLKYPVNRFCGSFWGSISSIQSNKRIAIDEYTYKEMQDDRFSNNALYTYYNYFNNSAIVNYNSYVKFSSDQGIYLLKYPRIVPQFIVDNNKIKIKIPEQIKIPKLNLELNKIENQSKPLSKEEATALNNYIEYINREIRLSRDRASHVRGYLKSVKRYKEFTNEKLQKYRPSYYDMTEDYRIALSKYHIAINDSRFLSENYAKKLNEITGSIKLICDKRRSLVYDYNQYIFNKGYIDNNFNKAEEFAESFEEIWSEFDLRTNKLYSLIKNIYNTYPKEFPDDPWQKSGDALYSMLEEVQNLLIDAKKHYKEGTEMTLNGDSINFLARKILTDQYKNMEGLKKIGRNHGHCPYTPYEDIPLDSKEFSIKYLKQKELETDAIIIGRYLEFVRKYDQIAEDYNKFVWLAYGDYERSKDYKHVYLLQAKREVDIFKRSEKEPTPKLINPEDDVKNIHSSMEGYASNNLILLLDVSFSMDKPEKLPLLKKSFTKLLKILRPEDKLAIIIYSGNAYVALESTSCSEKAKIKKVINNLESGGSTNILQGVETAYQTAKKNYITDGNNRILLATDGEFEVNSNLKKTIKKIKKDNIFLTVFHYGKNKKEKLELNELSQIGNGNYELITEKNSDEKLAIEAKAIRKK